MSKIGIFGGTFDPPHNGHLLMANEVLQALDLSEIWFMPNRIPPHKHDEQITDSADRLHMLELAISDHPQFKIETIELQREGPSYTYDTICQLKELYPKHQFYFIIGADMVEYLPNWYRIHELAHLVTFVGVGRPGFSLRTSYPLIEVESPEFAVSSSLIRERVREGKSIRYLVPERVRLYIEGKGLYESS
ncbi:nicotinate (nicotinamide) nucleotide adenylyltransferase [Anoxybacillus sp. B7M1]|jgi:nicotinate-nucleotide adenylyltransferase|uniref:Probable nicotinate-nucleotide adenylyltransferase n=1 Tax=Anoxybacteroides rupiense TaxID=311460 RepID=A0ABD5ITA2_9BACL|nr:MULTISPECIES: nicotinate-nucleotide adenylyltransferase [Anoxybacillus]ANB57798.1 nicotinate (nicotinamide) nucleotide adenylyltransferase [Anoxybacillus sp. B2M1]ANB65361.1 nicotinate (nicotinamide) nucleotide adenylyltransferase [Anoxybacillus sp. B7M1]MDE8562669.1 nicotinate-nucleotide adenylyltransferase [Anoxybacillus rupiensis]MED5050914.1 nicotinate-nucleotide adenylyltransferase [Anoxybacillus rupiensis]OQM44872.1 nicotinate-nicotinamide nucleotide adenylyltransferase [Anoxybacillus